MGRWNENNAVAPKHKSSEKLHQNKLLAGVSRWHTVLRQRNFWLYWFYPLQKCVWCYSVQLLPAMFLLRFPFPEAIWTTKKPPAPAKAKQCRLQWKPDSKGSIRIDDNNSSVCIKCTNYIKLAIIILCAVSFSSVAGHLRRRFDENPLEPCLWCGNVDTWRQRQGKKNILNYLKRKRVILKNRNKQNWNMNKHSTTREPMIGTKMKGGTNEKSQERKRTEKKMHHLHLQRITAWS